MEKTDHKRSYNMSRIRSKNTKPEITLRSALHKKGFRYRIHQKSLPGNPDIVLAKYKTVIFVHGCFWHLHQGCREGRIPKSKTGYWEPKLLRNVERDVKNTAELVSQGWKVIIVWDCEIQAGVNKVISQVERILSNQQ